MASPRRSIRPRVLVTASLVAIGSTAVAFASFGVRVATPANRHIRDSSRLVRRAEEAEDWSLPTVMARHATEVKQVKERVTNLPQDWDDLKLLRFVMQNPGDVSAVAANVKEVLAWRAGEGANMIAAAKAAVEKAKAGGGWDNSHIVAAAPHSSRISKYITPSQMVVVSTKAGDLVTCIRASTIDSEKMMKEVSEKEMVEFFLYCREVNSIVAEERTRRTGHVARLVSANDLTGVSKFPDQAFQNALTGSAKRAVTLYPGYSGPTVLLNLPWLARMLVNLLAPLFPGAVREKLKFARGPMAYLEDLKDVVKEPTRSLFVDDLQAVMNT